jgi:hypothetical protein
MGGGGSKEWPLKYWLSGEDAPVNGKWVDRLNSDIQWEVGSRADYDSDNKRYYVKGRQSDGFLTINNANAKYNLGYHFKMIVQGTIMEAYSSSYFIDFASVRSAGKAMGWAFNGSKWGTNYKLSGNTSGSLYNVSSSAIAESIPFDFTVEYGCEAVTDTTSRMYILYKGDYYYGPTFNNILLNNFDNYQFRIGQGVAGNNFGVTMYLNDWKIYVEPYT